MNKDVEEADMNRRQLLTGSALLALGAQMTGVAAQTPAAEKKTFVLVPGAGWAHGFGEGSSRSYKQQVTVSSQ